MKLINYFKQIIKLKINNRQRFLMRRKLKIKINKKENDRDRD